MIEFGWYYKTWYFMLQCKIKATLPFLSESNLLTALCSYRENVTFCNKGGYPVVFNCLYKQHELWLVVVAWQLPCSSGVCLLSVWHKYTHQIITGWGAPVAGWPRFQDYVNIRERWMITGATSLKRAETEKNMQGCFQVQQTSCGSHSHIV